MYWFLKEIFEVDKQNDWVEFFEKYPDVVEPKECLDPEAEAKLSYNTKAMLADEDDLDDDDFDGDEELEPATCSNSSILPPTPDLIGRYNPQSCEYLL